MPFPKIKDADTAAYVLDFVADLTPILMELNGSSVEKTYIYANGQILAQHTGDHTASRYFFLHDRLGSVRLLIDTSGDVQNRYIYGPFGKLHNNSNDFEEEVPACGSFRFTGQYFDSEIDQYYLRARQYYPHIGRFTTRDPVLGQFESPLSLHKYLYCRNDPTKLSCGWIPAAYLRWHKFRRNDRHAQPAVSVLLDWVRDFFVLPVQPPVVGGPWRSRD